MGKRRYLAALQSAATNVPRTLTSLSQKRAGANPGAGRLARQAPGPSSRRSGCFVYCVGTDTIGPYSGASARRRPTART